MWCGDGAYPGDSCGAGMSHDRNNKACPLHRRLVDDTFDWSECTCLPTERELQMQAESIRLYQESNPSVADEVEQIRNRNDETMKDLEKLNAKWLELQPVYQDRATLLRIVDQLRAENAKHAYFKKHMQEVVECAGYKSITDLIVKADDMRADLAAKNAEIERLREWIVENTKCTPDCTYWESDDDKCSCGRAFILEQPHD